MAQAQLTAQLMALPLLLAAVVVFATLHVRNHGGALKSVITSVWRICKESANQLPFAFTKSLEEEERTAQVEAALWDVRARAYMHSVQFMVHLSAAGCLGMLYALYMNPSVKQLVQLIFCSCVYLLHHLAIAGKLTLNAANLRRLFVLFQGSFVLFVLATPGGGDGRAIITQGFNACSRMIMAVIFMDTLTAVPLQLAISVAETAVHVMQTQHWADIILFAWMQTLVGCAIISFTVILEYWVISHISVLLDTESMVSSFRRMLRGVSDGEVLLNEEMHVCEDADCLKHLLMTQSNFKGKHFERLLMPEETCRFQDFLKQSMTEERKPDEQRTKTPPCLRISLRGASDIRVGVDLWHVLMPGRKDGVLHLLVLREDSEANATTIPTTATIPTATLVKNMPLGHLGYLPTSSTSTSAGDSDREPSESSISSMSQKSCTSLMQHFPELVDLTLCVDATTPWFDVEQAHLSFQRQPQSSDFSMPSLRRLVRPTDWETVRSKLKKVTDSSGSDRGSSGSDRSDLCLRLVDDAKRCMVSHGQVSKYTPPRGSDGVKLCLQLTEMVFEDKASRDWSLEAINE